MRRLLESEFLPQQNIKKKRLPLKRKRAFALRLGAAILSAHSLCVAAVQVTNSSGNLDAPVNGSYPWAVGQVNAGGASASAIDFQAGYTVDLTSAATPPNVLEPLTNANLQTITSASGASTINGGSSQSFRLQGPGPDGMVVTVQGVKYSGAGATIQDAAAIFRGSNAGLDVGTIFLQSGTLAFDAAATIQGNFQTGQTSPGVSAKPTVRLIGSAPKTLSGNWTLNSDTWLQAGAVSTSIDALTLAGKVSGPAGLYVSDTGAIVFKRGDNDYEGGTRLLAGEIDLAVVPGTGSTPLGSGDVSMYQGTFLGVDSGDPYNLPNAWHLVDDYDGPSQVYILTQPGQQLQLSGNIDQQQGRPGVDKVGLRKQGAGTLILAGVNSFPGDVFIDEGLLAVASNTGLGDASQNLVSVAGLGTLEIDPGLSIANAIQFETPESGSYPKLASTSGESTLNGSLQGASFEKIGAGTLIVANTNPELTGTVAIREGKLLVGQAPGLTVGSLGSGPIVLGPLDGTSPQTRGFVGASGIDGTFANPVTVAPVPGGGVYVEQEAVLVLSGNIAAAGETLAVQGDVPGDASTPWSQVGLQPTTGGNTQAGTTVEKAKLFASSEYEGGRPALGLGTSLTLKNASFQFGSAYDLAQLTAGSESYGAVTVSVDGQGYFDPGGTDVGVNTVAPQLGLIGGVGRLDYDPQGGPGCITFWDSLPAGLTVDFVANTPYFLDATGPTVSVGPNETLSFVSGTTSPTTVTKAITGTGRVAVSAADNPAYTLSIQAPVTTTGGFTIQGPAGSGAGDPAPTAQIDTQYAFSPGALELNNGTLAVSRTTGSAVLDLTAVTIKTGSAGEANNTIVADGVELQYANLDSSSQGQLRLAGSGQHTFTADNPSFQQQVQIGGGTTVEVKTAAALGTGQGSNRLKMAGLSEIVLNAPSNSAFILDVLFDDDPTFTVRQAQVWNARIGGTGPLIKQGPGQLSLPAQNTFTGGVTINESTVAINSDASLGDSAGDVRFTAAGTGLTFQASAALNAGRTLDIQGSATLDSGIYAVSVAGPVQGGAPLAKTGAGSLALNSNSPAYTGTLSHTAGTLAVNGSFGGAGSSVDVDGGATLTGGGRVERLALAGTLAAAGVKAVAVNTDSTFASTAAFNANVTPSASSNHEVGGQASVNGDLRVTIRHASDAYVIGDRYPLVTANGGVSGRFAQANLVGDGVAQEELVTRVLSRSQNGCCTFDACCQEGCCVVTGVANGPGAAWALVYAPNQIYLEVLKGSFPAGRPLCCPAAGIYDYLTNYPVGTNADLRAIYADLARLRDCAFSEALIQLSPANWDGMSQSAQELSVLSQTINSQRVGLLAHTPCADQRNGMRGWFGAVGGGAQRDGDEGFSGWSAGLLQIGLGTDYTADAWRVGGSFTYGNDHTSWVSPDNWGRLQTYGGTLYASWTGESAYIYGSAYGAGATYDGRREICFPGVQRTACNTHSGSTLALRLGLGWTAKFGNVSVIPYVDGDLSAIHEGDWTETGAGALNLSVDDRTVSYGRLSLGVAVAGCRGNEESGLEAVAGLGYTYQNAFHDPCLVSRFGCDCVGDCLALSGNNRTQNMINPSLSLKWHWMRNWEFLLQGGANIGSGTKSGYGLGQLVYRF
jgi:autotransporter-associated beta strand protein